MRYGISMNLFSVTESDCSNLEVYSGRILVSQIFAHISSNTPIYIKQAPNYGTLVDSEGKELDTVSSYPMNDIHYKTNAYKEDSFYYVINKG
jgi:hypothetical protein